MPRRTPLASELGLAFTTRDARALGVSGGRLKSPDIAHPFRGVNTRGEPETLRERCHAFASRMTGAWAFSHVTAAVLHGAPLPPGLAAATRALDVAVVAPRTAPVARGVTGHKLAGGTVAYRMLDGLPVVSADDVFCQLSAQLTREDLVAVGDFLLSGDPQAAADRSPLCTRAQLQASAARHRGKRGAKALAWALERIREQVDSRPESLLRLLLVDAGLPEPLVNQPAAVDGGRRRLRPDLSLPRWMTAFEFQGDGHRDRRQWLNDMERLALLRAAGWEVVEVTARDLFFDRQGLLRRVMSALRRQGYPS